MSSKMRKETKLAAVLVTYNRIDFLKQTLPRYSNQSLTPDYIIVVNNGSDDGTLEYLSDWSNTEEYNIKKIVVNNVRNLGGSGGIYAGLERAIKTDADYIWVADDDAFIHEDAFEKFYDYISNNKEEINTIAAICAQVFPHKLDFAPSCFFLKRGLLRDLIVSKKVEEFKSDTIDVDFYPFLGVILKKEALLAAGNVRRSFFIYQDDFEHSIRIKKQGRIIIYKPIILEHDGNSSFRRQASWRDYYETRNALLIEKEYFRKSSFILRIVTRLLRALSTCNPLKIKIYFVGVMDAIKGNEGIHDVYKPGWKCENIKNNIEH